MAVLNFKNRKNQEKFRDETSKGDKSSTIFETNEDIHSETNTFIKKLNEIMFKCFDEIRVGKNKKK